MFVIVLCFHAIEAKCFVAYDPAHHRIILYFAQHGFISVFLPHVFNFLYFSNVIDILVLL